MPSFRFYGVDPYEVKPAPNSTIQVIVTEVAPAIPERGYDWTAYVDGQEEGGPYGWGPTVPAALRALAEEMEGHGAQAPISRGSEP